MLLRSSSNPSLNSFFKHQTHNHSPDHSNHFFIKKSPSFSLLTKTSSETDLTHAHISRRHSLTSRAGFEGVQGPSKISPIHGTALLTSTVNCLRNACVHVMEEDVEGEEVCTVVGGGGDGGRVCGGYGGGGGGEGEGEGSGDVTDLYYKSMIHANPGNSLILGNYAKYLKEVRGDLVKAEEYCSRAILANPSDGNALSMYADLIWVTQKDSSRAETYFDQAVKASPDDCYVMASYARFLWDADEEDEEEVSSMNTSPPSFLHETSQQFPVAAT